MSEVSDSDVALLQQRLVAFVRAFGLHQPDQTPCGQPIPVSEAHALSELGRDAPFTQAELGRRLRLEKSTISRLVGQLVEQGWVARARDPHDGRAALLSLTPVGERTASNLADARQRKFADLLAGIPPDERDAVLHALKTLTEGVR